MLFPDDWYVNLSLWKDVNSFKNFVYAGMHERFLKKKQNWFLEWNDVENGPKQAMWWTKQQDGMPSLEQAVEKLSCLRKNGPSVEAFDINSPFPPPDI